MVSVVGPFVYNEDRSYTWVAGFVVVIVLVALADRRIRATVLGIGAGLIAVWTPEAVYLWTLVASLVMLSIIEDRRRVPVVAWAAGLVGSVGSLVAAPESLTVASFLAVGLGGGLGLSVRSRSQTASLTKEAGHLRHQARWLEQRTVLARELHDVVGHHVTAMVVQAEAGLVRNPTQALESIGDLGRTALTELDALVVHLRDPDAPLALSAPPRLSDIDEVLAAPLRQQGVHVEVEIDDDLGLDDTGVLAVYRITQEALTNVTRHADAGTAWVELSRRGDRVRLRISDDGVGAPPTPARGSGLLGIHERVAARKGHWELNGRPGGGTMVDVTLPVVAP